MNRLAHALPILAACIAAPTFATPTTAPPAGPELYAAAPEASLAADDFTDGTRALDQQRWQDAVTDFDKATKVRDKRADAALYWKAYALNKLNRPSLVTVTCTQLRTDFPRSTWGGDCDALTASTGAQIGRMQDAIARMQQHRNEMQARIPSGSGAAVEGSGVTVASGSHSFYYANGLSGSADAGASGNSTGSDADLKMLALNSVLQRDPNRAIPAIRDILTGNNPPELKRRAINVLAMSLSPEAQATLRDVATGKLAPTEQKRAIQMLGVYQGKRAGDTLAEIYRNSADPGLKHAALSGLFVSGNAQQLVDLARNEKHLKLKHDIVAQLALMQDKVATDYMLELLK